MYVCICNAITDTQINKAQQNGYITLQQITRHLGVGNCCGRCVPTAKALLNQETASNDNTVQQFLPQAVLA